MTDQPTDATIEPTWLIEATYAPDAAETRVPFRGSPLARLVELMDAGVVVAAGCVRRRLGVDDRRPRRR